MKNTVNAIKLGNYIFFLVDNAIFLTEFKKATSGNFNHMYAWGKYKKFAYASKDYFIEDTDYYINLTSGGLSEGGDRLAYTGIDKEDLFYIALRLSE